MSDFLSVAKRAALEAGDILISKLGKVGAKEKNPADFVTEADVAAQRKIEEVVLAEFPDHCFLGEESQGATPSFGPEFASRVPAAQTLKESQCGSRAPANQPYTWIVDPLDGTTNFVHRAPFFCVSIALAKGNDLLCAVIYDPNLKELFTAERGSGAYLNGERIHTSSIVRPSHALAAFSFAASTRSLDAPDVVAFKRCVTICQSMRRSGSTALNLAYVAAGRYDAASCQCAHPWDVAAGALLVLEAGGLVTHTNGRPFDLAEKPLLATANSDLHRSFLSILNQ